MSGSGQVSVSGLLEWAQAELGAHSEARTDAMVLLESLVGISRASVYARPEHALTSRQVLEFKAAIDRRCTGEPVAYILGKRAFHELDLQVDRHVLVPRPETELIVDEVLELAPALAFTLLDLGVGSGALALAIAHARRDAEVTAVDVSIDALAVAAANAAALGIDVEFIESNWFADLPVQAFDFIVCNPPYVRSQDAHMQALRFEPQLALDGGIDGLDSIRAVLADAPGFLRRGGRLLLEHGYDQASAVAGIAAQSGLWVERVLTDLAGHQRVTIMSRTSD